MDPNPAQPRYRWSQRLLLALLPPVAGLIIRLWAKTWRVRLAVPRELDPRYCQQRYIYAFWHEGVVTIIPHWRDSQIQGLASQSFDGALISALMRYLGFPPPARGSSSRGGAGALKAHVDALAQGLHVAISVDGPRGPRYQSKPGVVQLAALTGHAIVPVSGVARPDIRLRNWDQTMVPPPFARLAFVLGEPILVQPGAEAEALERLNSALMGGLEAAAVFLDGSKWTSS
jgi:lysophospholipid acyltransferase (LPLAT)-like uncharacterized protein